MHLKTVDTKAVLDSRLFVWSALAGAALLVSPTFSLGCLSSTLRRGVLLAAISAAYAFAFFLLFMSQVPSDLGDIHDAYESLSFWTPVIGSAAPFVAGVIFRFAWTRNNPRMAAAAAVAAFGVLAFGSAIVTEHVDDLAEASNVAAGRAEALSALAREALGVAEGREGTTEYWTARFIAARAASQIIGKPGPNSLEEFIAQAGKP